MGIENKGLHTGGRTKVAASPVQDEAPDPERETAEEHGSIDGGEETRSMEDETARLDKE